jgi:hypothetical protein
MSQMTAMEAERLIDRWTAQQNRGRKVPHLSELEKEFSMANCVHIYNVGPWDHLTYEQGTLGTYFIPACPEDKEFIRGPVLPGIFIELVPDDEKRFKQLRDDGRFVALDIVGVGKMRPKRDSLVTMGCFVGDAVGPDAEPSATELKAARKCVETKMLELFKEADDAFRLGPKAFSEVSSKDHLMAANWLERTDVDWMKASTPTANLKCPKCGTRSESETMMCPTANCGHIFDIPRYVAYEAEQKRLLAAARR